MSELLFCSSVPQNVSNDSQRSKNRNQKSREAEEETIHGVTHGQMNAGTGNKDPVCEKHNNQSDQFSDQILSIRQKRLQMIFCFERI